MGVSLFSVRVVLTVALASLTACSSIGNDKVDDSARDAKPDAGTGDDADAGDDEADAAPALDCIEGDGGRIEFEGRCYSKFTASKNWVDAEAACVAVGGHLASLTSTDEVAQADVILGNTRVWIGINDRTTENAFVWSSGEVVAFTDWDGGQPDNGSGSEDCGLVRGNDSRRWDDDQCGNDHPYMCER